MRITISGTPGSGKSTIAQFLAEKMDLERYYMGGILRELSKKRGLTLRQYLELGEKDPTVDKEVDDYQVSLADEDDWVIEGRTSFHLLPDSIKVFITVSPQVGVQRIFDDKKERNEGSFNTVEDLMIETEKRMQSDRKRYHKYYGIDVFDPENYDIVIDTTDLSLEEAEKKTLDAIKNFSS